MVVVLVVDLVVVVVVVVVVDSDGSCISSSGVGDGCIGGCSIRIEIFIRAFVP